MREIAVKRYVMAASAALVSLLAGCASTIRSDVTTFHQWPAVMQDKTYVFEAPPAQDDTLEFRSYQNLVRGELARLGFQDGAAAGQANLKVAMRFSTTAVPVRVIEPVYSPFFSSPRHGFMGPYRRGWYHPSYRDPFWYMPEYQVTLEQAYRRELQVAIKSAADGKRLFDVTVHNLSDEVSTPAIMPALVRAAFEGFPGPSGVARRVELKRLPQQ